MPDKFDVIIAGSRQFSDYETLKEKCDKFFSAKRPTAIVCGEAAGADALGKRYANERGIPVKSFPAQWDTYGKRAGFIRNEEMAKNADALVAFWDGKSHGTKHMIDTAEKHGLAVRVVKF